MRGIEQPITRKKKEKEGFALLLLFSGGVGTVLQRCYTYLCYSSTNQLSIMAKILFTAFMADARGKVAGSVFSKNRGGAYVRTKVTPVNGQTTAQMGVRAMTAQYASLWRTLSTAEQKQWSDYAATRPRNDIFGNPKALSGFQFFMSANRNLGTIGQGPILFPVAPPGYPASVISNLTADYAGSSTPNGTLRFEQDIAEGAGWQMVVQATAPVSNGMNYLKNLYRQIAVEPTVSAGTPPSYNVYLPYAARFGGLENSNGFKVGVRVYYIATLSGEATPPQELQATVTATP